LRRHIERRAWEGGAKKVCEAGIRLDGDQRGGAERQQRSGCLASARAYLEYVAAGSHAADVPQRLEHPAGICRTCRVVVCGVGAKRLPTEGAVELEGLRHRSRSLLCRAEPRETVGFQFFRYQERQLQRLLAVEAGGRRAEPRARFAAAAADHMALSSFTV
jgi:ferredoxin